MFNSQRTLLTWEKSHIYDSHIFCDSQPRVTLTPSGQLAMPGDMFDCHNLGEQGREKMLLVPSREELGKLLNILS